MSWFNSSDINKFDDIIINNLHGYVLPHAGTLHSGNIISHTLRFKPSKSFNNILIIYYPANEKPNVEEYYHEFFVPKKSLEVFFKDKNIIGYNAKSPEKNLDTYNLNIKNTLYVISADFSHFLKLNEAIKKENCAAKSLMHKIFNLDCIECVDHVESFKFLYSLLPDVVLQWIGRTMSRKSVDKDGGVGYLSFLIRDKPEPNIINNKPDKFFVSVYDDTMQIHECIGDNNWSLENEKTLIHKCITKGYNESRLTGGILTKQNLTNYSITYLYFENSKDFIRGYHGISKGSLYLPDVFLENTYDNGKWINEEDLEWPQENIFKLEDTFEKINKKSLQYIGKEIKDYDLYSSEVDHRKIIQEGGSLLEYKYGIYNKKVIKVYKKSSDNNYITEKYNGKLFNSKKEAEKFVNKK